MAGADKRQRQKDQKRAKIEQEIREYKARRRRRLAINGVVLLVAVGAVALLVVKSQKSKNANATASPTPSASPGGVACGGAKPPKGNTTPATSSPPMTVDKSKTYTATIETSCGKIVIALAAGSSPQTVNSFVSLARRGFYDGLTFHRIVPGFAIQGGDPKGDGSGGPGYSVTEAPPALTKYQNGTVAMAKAGAEPAGASGSQFFIVPGDKAASLNGTAQSPAAYAVLGTVTSGSEVLTKIEAVPRSTSGEGSTPLQTIYIVKITITES
jgi:cyclophilin family peptidyl-prolyl cis-trans isomerase